jgi:NADPH-dependent 2,4-dienoyl-CoA reductase/sulfur reductase-like enzyme
MPEKARQGRLDDIRLCVGCNEGCWEQITSSMPITCAQNPEAGNEGILKIEPAPEKKKVMIVGGGVAGMEAAITAKKRGHLVTLYEKSGHLGGALLTASKAPARAELAQVVRFREHEIKRLGIDVRLNIEVTGGMVAKENPDVVIIATGATAINDPSPDIVGVEASIEIEDGAHVVGLKMFLKDWCKQGSAL